MWLQKVRPEVHVRSELLVRLPLEKAGQKGPEKTQKGQMNIKQKTLFFSEKGVIFEGKNLIVGFGIFCFMQHGLCYE
ncbi:MAG: hypothetical protein V1847_01230 [Candidatus Diapherotrites archaeon]